jgi:hypothetical protein
MPIIGWILIGIGVLLLIFFIFKYFSCRGKSSGESEGDIAGETDSEAVSSGGFRNLVF